MKSNYFIIHGSFGSPCKMISKAVLEEAFNVGLMKLENKSQIILN